jgi:hypothetical protein
MSSIWSSTNRPNFLSKSCSGLLDDESPVLCTSEQGHCHQKHTNASVGQLDKKIVNAKVLSSKSLHFANTKMSYGTTC